MEDQNELLQCSSDDESLESEEQCPPTEKSNDRHHFIYKNHSKTEFIALQILLICSTTLILILLPLNMKAVNVRGNVYSFILTCSTFSAIVLTIFMIIMKSFFMRYKNIRLIQPPLRWSQLLLLSCVYFLCGFMIIYALDRNRVACHLQDPIKGIVLVWSLLYYFFFCQRFMGLQRIFSVTIIIIGLFVAVDYGLCDEFKCRGYERQRISDDTGEWSLQIHAIWTSVYIGGLALFAAYVTLLERNLLTGKEMDSSASTFLNYTVNGILCHFDLPVLHNRDCNDLPVFSWLFLCSYLVFVVSSMKFLILSQSAVHTTATMTTALPLAGIWWSVVQMTPSQNGLLVLAPSFSGELISSLLGLPIVTVGLYLLYNSHFKEYQRSRMTTHFLQAGDSA
ncbi:hypothetical protein BDFB_008418, partial [Asbolus verrucosus]